MRRGAASGVTATVAVAEEALVTGARRQALLLARAPCRQWPHTARKVVQLCITIGSDNATTSSLEPIHSMPQHGRLGERVELRDPGLGDL